MYGIQRVEFLDDVLVLCGASVGGGSHVYGNTLYTPPKKFFEAPEWSGITDWADELAPSSIRRNGCSASSGSRTWTLRRTA
jgi:cholesterol oxidase